MDTSTGRFVVRQGIARCGLFCLLLLCVNQMGCASRSRHEAGPPVSFEQVVAGGEGYAGAGVIWGGYILETLNQPEGSRLKILQTPLGFRNKPKERDLSLGRFFVKSGKFLDPAVYSKDRKLTVWGTLHGVEREPLGNRMYEYPVVNAGEIRLWSEEIPSPWWPYDPFYDCWPYRGYGRPYGPYRCR